MNKSKQSVLPAPPINIPSGDGSGDENNAGEENFPRRLFRKLLKLLAGLPLIGRPDDRAIIDFDVNPAQMQLQDRAKFWEAEYGPFPRPITEQHLTSYAAWRRISAELTLTATVLFNSLICAAMWMAIGYFLHLILHFVGGESWAVSFERMWAWWILGWCVALLAPLAVITLVDGAFKLWKPFYTFEQRETFGTSKWLMPKQIFKSHRWLFRFEEPEIQFSASPYNYCFHLGLRALRRIYLGRVPCDPLRHQMFPVAPFGYGTWICYPLTQFARHLVLFGIPGSGKSASFIMSYVRSASRLGSSFVMDIKGEMYACGCHYYKKVFRLDFEESHKSHRFLIGRLLRRDYDFARTIAQSIAAYDPDAAHSGNQFFRSTGAQLLAALLLHLAEDDPDFTPADIFKFLEEYPADDQENGLVRQLRMSGNRDVRQIIAGMPTRAPETFDGILSNMTESLQSFKDPHVIRVFTPPTAEEKAAGCEIFDPFLLRTKSTGVFVVVTEGKAKRLGNVLGTVINITYNVLRRTGSQEEARVFLPEHAVRMLAPSQIQEFTGEFRANLVRERGATNFEELREQISPEDYARMLSDALTDYYLRQIGAAEALEKPCFVFFIVDEAGNTQITGLREKTGVGRAFKTAFILVYHNVAQMQVQFGKDYSDAVKGTVGTRIFLPGLEGETARYASFLLRRTTVLQHSGTDARNDNYDSTRLQEIGRDLMTEDEVRTMLEYKQAVMVSFALSPMRIAFPRLQTKVDPRLSAAPEFGKPLIPAGLTKEIAEYESGAKKLNGDSETLNSLNLNLENDFWRDE